MKTLAEHLYIAAQARNNCFTSGNTDWLDIWDQTLDSAEEALPHGSGFDSYPKVDLEKVSARHLVIRGSYHAMDQHGGYDGWRDYTIHVWSEFDGPAINCIGGGEHKDYIEVTFCEALTRTYPDHHFKPATNTEDTP